MKQKTMKTPRFRNSQKMPFFETTRKVYKERLCLNNIKPHFRLTKHNKNWCIKRTDSNKI